MKLGIHSLYTVFNVQDNIFNPEAYPIGENLEYSVVLLREILENKGCTLNTLDFYPIEQFKKIIFLDYPSLPENELKNFVDLGIELYLVILESELIHPKNFDKSNHILFKKIFTWADDLVDDEKYYKLNVSNKIPKNFSIDTKKKTRFCTNISGNKISSEPNELYTERVNAIEWFERNFPDQFDLYGLGWGNYTFLYPFGRLNKFQFLRKFFGKKYSVYKGTIKKKIKVLEQYKFSICYENINGNRGYISEKIFDCFLSGTIPIYLGEENICNKIPSNIFIDKRNFKTYEDLYTYISTMSPRDYQLYIKAIEEFVNGPDIYFFSSECFANVIVENIGVDTLEF